MTIGRAAGAPGSARRALQLFVGYGIGAYTFRAADWGLVLAVIGTHHPVFRAGRARRQAGAVPPR